MPREALTVDFQGERFRFYFDEPGVLHITRVHGTSPQDAIRAFFSAESTRWNAEHRRYETISLTHQLLWARHAYDGSVIVISCWRHERDAPQID